MSVAGSFNNLSASQKRMTMVGAAVIAVLGISYTLASVSEKKSNRLPHAEKAEVTVVAPSRTTGVEAFNAQLATLQKSQDELKTRVERMLKEGESTPSRRDLEPKQEPSADEDVLPELTGQTSIFEAPTKKGDDLPVPVSASNAAATAPVGLPPAPAGVTAAPQAPAPTHAARTIRLIGESGEVTDEGESKLNASPEVSAPETKNQSAFVPAGSMFTGVLLSGLDAPTSAVAQKNPTPVVVRVKREAVLPNFASLDVRECFVMAAGYGQLSSERALMRTEALSCVRQDGNVIETNLDAYIVGTDGKVGIPGRLVSKQGQMIAQTLLAGTLGGIGQALGRSRTPTLNLNGAGALYESESVSSITQSGIAGGISSASNMIAKFYLDMAKETFPVVEIPAGEVVTVVVTRGSTLPLKGSTNLQRVSAPQDNPRVGALSARGEPQQRAAANHTAAQAPVMSPPEAAIKAAQAATSAAHAATPNFQNGLGW